MTYHASDQVDGLDLVNGPFFGSRQVYPETVMRQGQRIDHAAAPSARRPSYRAGGPTPPTRSKAPLQRITGPGRRLGLKGPRLAVAERSVTPGGSLGEVAGLCGHLLPAARELPIEAPRVRWVKDTSGRSATSTSTTSSGPPVGQPGRGQRSSAERGYLPRFPARRAAAVVWRKPIPRHSAIPLWHGSRWSQAAPTWSMRTGTRRPAVRPKRSHRERCRAPTTRRRATSGGFARTTTRSPRWRRPTSSSESAPV